MRLFFLFLFSVCLQPAFAQTEPMLTESPLVDFDAYVKLAQEVQKHRKDRLISLQTFNKWSAEDNVVILDTRSDSMYLAKHVKGAIHLNFSDFTQANLERLIPDKNTKILIYCNNNFGDDEIYFPTKSFTPPRKSLTEEREITLALNIPTFINLYGYGYKNVYELGELISVYNAQLLLEGTAMPE